MVARSVKSDKQNSAGRGSDFQQAEFIQRELTAEEQRKCKDWQFSDADMADWLLKLIDERYKVTYRYDDFNECYACWLLPERGHHNQGLILSGRGSSPFKAFKQALYKHGVLFEGDWPRDVDKRGKGTIDD